MNSSQVHSPALQQLDRAANVSASTFPDLWFTSGAADAIQELRALGKKVLFVTNSSARSRAALLQKLDSIGIEGGDEDEMITAASAVALHLTTARTRSLCFTHPLCETAAICLPVLAVSPIAASVYST